MIEKAKETKEKEKSKVALISVTNKAGIVEFVKELRNLGYSFISTGGTAAAIKDIGIEVQEVAEFTGSPEMLDGRVKTLHPKIHGSILADLDNPSHLQDVKHHGLRPIGLVVCNLYKFREEAIEKTLPIERAVEFIDIGGVTLLRAAAKNFQHVLPVVDPGDYPLVIQKLKEGEVSLSFRKLMAHKAFTVVAEFDRDVAAYFSDHAAENSNEFPHVMTISLKRGKVLRYGENPHQQGAFYIPQGFYYGTLSSGFEGDAFEVLQGKELSYNNLLDVDAAINLAHEFIDPAVVIIKHTNPCGVVEVRPASKALGVVSPPTSFNIAEAFSQAFETDKKSPFGGIVAVNREIDGEAAERMNSVFLECVVAPSFSSDAIKRFETKKNLRLIVSRKLRDVEKKKLFPTKHSASLDLKTVQMRSVLGGVLIQTPDYLPDRSDETPSEWKVVTKKSPTPAEWEDMKFALKVVKHVKSNAIVFAKDGRSLGVGSGQMNRVDSAKIAAMRADEFQIELRGSVLASDAFFPFSDTVLFAASRGISAIIQPGGSMRDQDSIKAADAANIAMVFTGERHFRH